MVKTNPRLCHLFYPLVVTLVLAFCCQVFQRLCQATELEFDFIYVNTIRHFRAYGPFLVLGPAFESLPTLVSRRPGRYKWVGKSLLVARGRPCCPNDMRLSVETGMAVSLGNISHAMFSLGQDFVFRFCSLRDKTRIELIQFVFFRRAQNTG